VRWGHCLAGRRTCFLWRVYDVIINTLFKK